jgi:hypothetical protein
MCRRIIQSSGPLRYAIVDGLNVHDSRVHNYPPRRNAATSQKLLVIRRNPKTGEVSLDPLRWGLIPYWCKGTHGWAQADQRQVRDGRAAADVPRRLPPAPRRLMSLCYSGMEKGWMAYRIRFDHAAFAWIATVMDWK